MQFNLISGFMLGFELVDDNDDSSTYLVIDLFIIRILVDITC